MSTADQCQQKVIEATDKNILCIAAPGSGKSFCLVNRVVHLIQNRQVSPHEVCMVTFTRLAAQEMKKRIEAQIGEEKAKHITIGTYHSIALRTLKRFGEMIGYKIKNITVYGSFEENFMIKEIAQDMGIFKKTWNPPKKDIDEVFLNYYSKGIPPEPDNKVYPLFQEFVNRCFENQSLPYGGLLVAFRLLYPKIAHYLKWQHILVDEAHDNNTIQFDVVRGIQSILDSNLFIICDLDQSIYKFREATPEWILNHQHEFKTYFLENNYRSVPDIVEASNNLIRHNTQRIEKTMRAVRTVDYKGEFVGIRKDLDSAKTATRIKNSLGNFGVLREEITVLCRVHTLLNKLSEELTLLGIPHKKIGRKTELVESEEFRKFCAFLKLLVNPFDNFCMLLARDSLGLSRAEYNQIRLKATQESKSHFQAWHRGEPETYDCPLSELFLCIPATPEIDDFVQAWIDDNPGGTISDYLNWLATWDVQDELKADDDNCVKLCTIHSVKGLEFPVVLVIGCNEGIMPSKQSVAAGDIEEERRIMYVAMTRAEDKLILCVRPEITEGFNGKIYDNPVSRFVGEIKDEERQ